MLSTASSTFSTPDLNRERDNGCTPEDQADRSKRRRGAVRPRRHWPYGQEHVRWSESGHGRIDVDRHGRLCRPARSEGLRLLLRHPHERHGHLAQRLPEPHRAHWCRSDEGVRRSDGGTVLDLLVPLLRALGISQQRCVGQPHVHLGAEPDDGQRSDGPARLHEQQQCELRCQRRQARRSGKHWQYLFDKDQHMGSC